MVLDRSQGRWGGWRYYGLAFAIIVGLYVLWLVLLYGERGLGWKTFGVLSSAAVLVFFIGYLRRRKTA